MADAPMPGTPSGWTTCPAYLLKWSDTAILGDAQRTKLVATNMGARTRVRWGPGENDEVIVDTHETVQMLVRS